MRQQVPAQQARQHSTDACAHLDNRERTRWQVGFHRRQHFLVERAVVHALFGKQVAGEGVFIAISDRSLRAVFGCVAIAICRRLLRRSASRNPAEFWRGNDMQKFPNLPGRIVP